MKHLLLVCCLLPATLLAQPSNLVWVHSLEVSTDTINAGHWMDYQFKVSQSDSVIHEIPLWEYFIRVSIYSGGQPGTTDSIVGLLDYPPFDPTNTASQYGRFLLPPDLPAGPYFLKISSNLGDISSDPSLNTYDIVPFYVRPFDNGPCTGVPLVLGQMQCNEYLPDGSLQWITKKGGSYYQYTIDTAANVVENIWYTAPYEITADLYHDTLVRHEVYRPTVFETRIIPSSLYGAYHSFKDVVEWDGGYVFTAFKNAPFYPAIGAPNTADLELTLLKTDHQFNVLSSKTYHTTNEGWPSLTVLDDQYFAFGYGLAGNIPSAHLLVMDGNLDVYSDLKTYEDQSYPLLGFGPSVGLSKNICGQYSYSGGRRWGVSPFGLYNNYYTATVLVDAPELIFLKNKRDNYSYGTYMTSWEYGFEGLSPTAGQLNLLTGNLTQLGWLPIVENYTAHTVGSDTLHAQLQAALTPNDELIQLGSRYFLLRPAQGDTMLLIPTDCNQAAPVSTHTPQQAEVSLGIFPNPVTSRCWITGLDGHCQLRVYDALGQLVYECSATGYAQQPFLLQLPRLMPGTYWLQAVGTHQPAVKIAVEGP